MSEATQVLTLGRRINVPLPEVFSEEVVYFKSSVEVINFARPDGGRISFVRNWYKTNNVHDIKYLRLLIAEGQHGISEVDTPNVEVEYANAFDPEAQNLEALRGKISADPRFAAAIAEMLRTAGSDTELLRSLHESAEASLSRRNSTSESNGRAMSGIANSQSLSAVAAVSSSDTSGDKKEAASASPTLPDAPTGAGTMLKR